MTDARRYAVWPDPRSRSMSRGFWGSENCSFDRIVLIFGYIVQRTNTKILSSHFLQFPSEPKLWRHQWRNFRFCRSCRRAMRFSPLDSADDFMRRCGLRFCLSLIVSELWRHNDVFSTFAKVVVQRCGLHPRPWTIVAQPLVLKLQHNNNLNLFRPDFCYFS